jgi:hypothetical protein
MRVTCPTYLNLPLIHRNSTTLQQILWLLQWTFCISFDSSDPFFAVRPMAIVMDDDWYASVVSSRARKLWRTLKKILIRKFGLENYRTRHHWKRGWNIGGDLPRQMLRREERGTHWHSCHLAGLWYSERNNSVVRDITGSQTEPVIWSQAKDSTCSDRI